MKRLFAIIPARYASSRFPGKPLADIGGTSMIMHVYRRAERAGIFEQVFVATDDERIMSHVSENGGNCVMTKSEHQTGTSRCAEVAATLPSDAVVFNIQGDEPFIQAEELKLLARLFEKNEVQIGTLVKEMADSEDVNNPNIVKAVVDSSGKALYFSRAPIPYRRDMGGQGMPRQLVFYRHLGLYAYRADVLQEIAGLPPSPLMQAEMLEQLNWLENGYTLHTAISPFDSLAVDTPDDLQKALAFLLSGKTTIQ